MKAELKPTDKPGVFGITIEDMTAWEGRRLRMALLRAAHPAKFACPVDVHNYDTLRSVISAGIAAVGTET